MDAATLEYIHRSRPARCWHLCASGAIFSGATGAPLEAITDYGRPHCLLFRLSTTSRRYGSPSRWERPRKDGCAMKATIRRAWHGESVAMADQTMRAALAPRILGDGAHWLREIART